MVCYAVLRSMLYLHDAADGVHAADERADARDRPPVTTLRNDIATRYAMQRATQRRQAPSRFEARSPA
jgi:hypothetical protein